MENIRKRKILNSGSNDIFNIAFKHDISDCNWSLEADCSENANNIKPKLCPVALILFNKNWTIDTRISGNCWTSTYDNDDWLSNGGLINWVENEFCNIYIWSANTDRRVIPCWALFKWVNIDNEYDATCISLPYSMHFANDITCSRYCWDNNVIFNGFKLNFCGQYLWQIFKNDSSFSIAPKNSLQQTTYYN